MRHKIIHIRWKLMMIVPSIFLTLNTVVFGIPLSMSYSNLENIKNEHFTQEYDENKLANFSCIVNGSKYKEGEHVPGAGPCEECICHPPNVLCSMMKCPTNSGCITIQLPNKCCPKYKCDCEHKGKVYNNGEKINKSDESACTVCFCNGGEIVCTSIVCYTRNDCQGYYLPGDCCPKYDNCSSNPIEQKPRESVDSKISNGRNIDFWSNSTEHNYNVDNIWKRDRTESQTRELFTFPNIITIKPLLFDSKKINMSLPNTFEIFNFSTPSSILEKNISDNKIYTSRDLVTEITVGDFNINEDSKTLFLGFETNNPIINEESTDSSLTNNGTSEITLSIDELFNTSDIDNSAVITHQNDTGNIEGTDEPAVEEFIDSLTVTNNTQVEIFNPNDLIIYTKRSMIELSTITPELDITTEMDYDGSKEATTPRAPDKLTIGPPHKLVINSTQAKLDDEINTEITFTDLEDTTDMFGPNFGQQPLTSQSSLNLDTIGPQIQVTKYKTKFLPTILTSSKNVNKTATESPQIKLFNQSSFNSTNIKSIKNNTLVNTEYNLENISVVTNNATEVYNDTIILDWQINNNTECVNNSCKDYTIFDSQTESTLTTPFIIETKVLPNQVSPPVIERKRLYPKEYPDEFETIQNGPSLTITKRTYTSIPDIVYTTTTMITLPTLDLIYKADKDIEKYLANQLTTTKPSNYLRPLKNV